MTDSAIASTTYVVPGALAWQPHHNDALNRLEQLAQITVVDRTTTSAPAFPAQGSAYIVASAATGDWSAQVDRIAAYYSGWTYLDPREGWQAYDQDTDQALVFDGSVWQLDWPQRYPAGEFKNRLLNGAANVWQRGTSVAPGATRSYVMDRFKGGRPSSKLASTYSRQAGFSGFRYCARVQRDNGNSDTEQLEFYTALETGDSVPLAGLEVTLSFYARKGASYSATSDVLVSRITTGTGTDENANGPPDASWTGNAASDQNNTLTGTEQQFSQTIAVPSDATQIGILFRFTPTGTAGATDYYEITGIQLELGPAATAFAHRQAGDELARCQRYYWIGGMGQAAHAWATTAVDVGIAFPVPMRIAPSVAYAPGVSQIDIVIAGGAKNSTTTPSSLIATVSGCRPRIASGFTGLNANDSGVLTTDCFEFDAEL